MNIKPGSIDAVLLDAGCSSMQMDQAERGFALSKDGPLDMRMDGERWEICNIYLLGFFCINKTGRKKPPVYLNFLIDRVGIHWIFKVIDALKLLQYSLEQ